MPFFSKCHLDFRHKNWTHFFLDILHIVTLSDNRETEEGLEVSLFTFLNKPRSL